MPANIIQQLVESSSSLLNFEDFIDRTSLSLNVSSIFKNLGLRLTSTNNNFETMSKRTIGQLFFFTPRVGVISVHFDKHFSVKKRLGVKHNNSFDRLDRLKITFNILFSKLCKNRSPFSLRITLRRQTNGLIGCCQNNKL